MKVTSHAFTRWKNPRHSRRNLAIGPILTCAKEVFEKVYVGSIGETDREIILSKQVLIFIFENVANYGLEKLLMWPIFPV